MAAPEGRAMSNAIQRITKVPTLAARKTDAHKGNFGRVLVIGGGVGMAGAPSMVGLSALRSGAGLVTIASPESVQPTVAGLCPSATTVPLPETPQGQIEPLAALDRLKARGVLAVDETRAVCDVVAVGPGLGDGTATYARDLWELIDVFRLGAGVAAVIDADALNLAARLSALGKWHCRSHPDTVITPHPGELGRLRGCSPKDIQAARERHARETAEQLNAVRPDGDRSRAVVVLKGAGTIVTDGKSLYVNPTGNPGMASGGSGDVLTGIIAALIGQGLSPVDAAVAGVHVHGLAGDIAAKRCGQVSLIATDIIDALPEAFQELPSCSS
jgi:NAD(P)H-hydrate epimerase